jgi:phosphoserine aminotransferase
MNRAHNFSAGPAVLPLSVIEELAAALPNFQETGLGLMELSHRSTTFDAVHRSAETRLRRVLSIPEDYRVLFLQGGASLQFHMIPLNLLQAGESADFLVTGVWAKKALAETQRFRAARVLWDGADHSYDRLPQQLEPSEDAVYLHYCSNNTIYGTQFSEPPSVSTPLICDMSSDICSRPVDISKHALVFAGAQKNLGPSGVTAVILSPWALDRAPGGLSPMLDYRLQVDKRGMFNTPNTFGIYALERVLNWIETQGGLTGVARTNTEKASALYTEIDRTGFWSGTAQRAVRSQMNVSFCSPAADLDTRFVAEAQAAGLNGLKGHRLVGGLRASIYNACPQTSVHALVEFMREFEATHG